MFLERVINSLGGVFGVCLSVIFAALLLVVQELYRIPNVVLRFVTTAAARAKEGGQSLADRNYPTRANDRVKETVEKGIASI